jgi:hypothetical protein
MHTPPRPTMLRKALDFDVRRIPHRPAPPNTGRRQLRIQRTGHRPRAGYAPVSMRYGSMIGPARLQQVTVPEPLATSTGRGYAEAVGFFALVFGTFAVTAILDGAASWGFHPDWSRVAYRWESLSQWSTLAVLTLWFAAVRRCRLIWAWAIGIAALISAYTVYTLGAMRTPDGLYEVIAASTATLLAIALARQRFVSLTTFGIGPGWGQRDYAGRSQASKVFWWEMAANVISAVIGSAIIAAGFAHGHSPIASHENPVGVVLRILSSGLIEEVVVAVVVIALSAARRPVWEMYALSCLMRVSYHMYYQTVGLSMIVMGLINVWLYRRSRRLTPIIVGHIVYDAMASARMIGPAWAVGAILTFYAATSLTDKYWAKPPDKESAAVTPEAVTAEKEPT